MNKGLNLFTLLPLFLIVISCEETGNIAPESKVDDIGIAQESQVAVNLDIKKVLEMVNAQRTTGRTCGNNIIEPMGELHWNDTLALLALNHSEDMYARDFFNHKNPDGLSASDRTKQSDYSGSLQGENIAAQYNSLSTVINLWFNSPSHCKNMMRKSTTEVGMARSKEGNYWTMVLGKE